MVKQVSTIHEAIAILGFGTVRSLAATTALIGTFSVRTPTSFNVTPFWRHSIAAAVCARELASRLDLNPEQAYIAGLLHDIGRLVLVTQFQPHYEATMAHRLQHDCGLFDAELAVLGLNHATVGLALTRHWKFPDAVTQAVGCHHASTRLDLQPLSLVVMAADAIAHALDLSMDEEDVVPPVSAGLLQKLGLDEQLLLKVLASTEKQFDGASSVLSA
jgi:putative nucleotidyltransferase with HDIG domain